MSERPKLISIVCPFCNEEDGVGPFYARLSETLQKLEDAYRFRLIFVDDGSRDATLAKLNGLAAMDERVQVYSLSRNFGYQVAVSAGLDRAKGAAAVVMDSDLQHPPELIPKMIDMWKQGFDVVSAIRERGEGFTWFDRAASGAFALLFNAFSETKVMPATADFYLLSRRTYRELQTMPERHRFLRGLVVWTGYRRGFVPYKAVPRAGSARKGSLAKRIGFAADAMLSFGTRPLRLATRLGVLIVVAVVAYLSYAIVAAAAGWREGVPEGLPLLCSVLLLGGVQLVFIGLIGEYLLRTFEQVKGRPLYVLKQKPRKTPKPRPEGPPATEPAKSEVISDGVPGGPA